MRSKKPNPPSWRFWRACTVRRTELSRLSWEALTSLKLTIFCLGLLMVLVAACTSDQVSLGTHLAVQKYIRSLFVWWEPSGASWGIPVFPGGGLVGFLLLLNLAASHFERLQLNRRKVGLWLVHFGLILLFLGEFVTGFFA